MTGLQVADGGGGLAQLGHPEADRGNIVTDPSWTWHHVLVSPFMAVRQIPLTIGTLGAVTVSVFAEIEVPSQGSFLAMVVSGVALLSNAYIQFRSSETKQARAERDEAIRRAEDAEARNAEDRKRFAADRADAEARIEDNRKRIEQVEQDAQRQVETVRLQRDEAITENLARTQEVLKLSRDLAVMHGFLKAESTAAVPPVSHESPDPGTV